MLQNQTLQLNKLVLVAYNPRQKISLGTYRGLFLWPQILVTATVIPPDICVLDNLSQLKRRDGN